MSSAFWLAAGLAASTAAALGEPLPPVAITSPSGWVRTAVPPPGIALQYLSAQAAPTFRPNLNISFKPLKPAILDSIKSPRHLGEHVAKSQGRIFPQFRVLAMEQRKAGGVQGSLMTASYAFGALDLVAYQFTACVKKDMVNVVYTCLRQDLDRLRPDFEKSLGTLTLAGSTP